MSIKDNKLLRKENNIGCGLAFKNINGMQKDCSVDKCDFICGVANAWGKEYLCQGCKQDWKIKWDEEDRKNLNKSNSLNKHMEVKQ